MRKLEVVGYELEVRPRRGLWSRFEGRVVKLVQSSGADEPYRDYFLPDHGPVRARTRERLEKKLRNMLNRRVKQQRDTRPERVSLEDTMAGWQ